MPASVSVLIAVRVGAIHVRVDICVGALLRVCVRVSVSLSIVQCLCPCLCPVSVSMTLSLSELSMLMSIFVSVSFSVSVSVCPCVRISVQCPVSSVQCLCPWRCPCRCCPCPWRYRCRRPSPCRCPCPCLCPCLCPVSASVFLSVSVWYIVLCRETIALLCHTYTDANLMATTTVILIWFGWMVPIPNVPIVTSRQSAKLFSSRRIWDSHNHSPAGECAPPPSEGRGTFAGERGGGRVPIPTRGPTLWYSLYMYMYFVVTRLGRKPQMMVKMRGQILLYCTGSDDEGSH